MVNTVQYLFLGKMLFHAYDYRVEGVVKAISSQKYKQRKRNDLSFPRYENDAKNILMRHRFRNFGLCLTFEGNPK